MTVKKLLALVAFSATTMCAIASLERTDFVTGEGTNGWTLSANEYVSPTYSSAVDSISLEYSGSGEGSATVYAAAHQNSATSQVATLTAVSSAATFDFSETTDFRSFKIKTSGDWSLAAFSAEVFAANVDAPVNVVISNNTTGTSFDASWDAVDGATGYRVYVWTNVVAGVSAGTIVWQETFAKASSTTSTQTKFKAEHTDNGTDEWVGDKAYLCSQEGAIRIGTTSGKGYLVSPSLTEVSGTELVLRITAWRQTTSEGTDMPVGVVSGDMTNIVGVIALGDVSATYHVSIPIFNAGDSIAIFSPTNKASARAIIDDVAILSGYSEGHSEPVYIANGVDVGMATEYSFAELPSVPVSFAVEACGRRGAVSAKTDAVIVDLSNPDKVAVLNALPLSELADGVYLQNFDSLSYVVNTTSGSPLFNGTTLPCWQMWQDNDAPTNIVFYSGGNQTGAKFLVLAAGSDESVRALGARTKKDSKMTWGIAFTNDTDSALTLTNIAYSAQQWGFANTDNHALVCSWIVTNRLDWIPSMRDGWVECCTTMTPCLRDAEDETPETVDVSYTPSDKITLPVGSVLYLKWTLESPSSGNSALMAIDDLKVMFAEKPLATLIFLTSR